MFLSCLSTRWCEDRLRVYDGVEYWWEVLSSTKRGGWVIFSHLLSLTESLRCPLFVKTPTLFKFKVSMVEWQHKNEASRHRTAKELKACLWVVLTLWHIERTNTQSASKKPQSTLWPTSVSHLDQKVYRMREAKADQCQTSFWKLKLSKSLVAWELKTSKQAMVGWAGESEGAMSESKYAQIMPRKYLKTMLIFFTLYKKSVTTIRKAENVGPTDILNMDSTLKGQTRWVLGKCRRLAQTTRGENRRFTSRPPVLKEGFHGSTCSDSNWKDTFSCDRV